MGGVFHSERARVQMALLPPDGVAYLSFGSLSLTAVLFGSYQGENDHYNSEALLTAVHTHAGVHRKCVCAAHNWFKEPKTKALN